MKYDAHCFSNYLTEKTIYYPRVKKVETLIPSRFYLRRVAPRVEQERRDADFEAFISNVRQSTTEAYDYAITGAHGYYKVNINGFITNLNSMLSEDEEKLPEVLTRPGNELFREWFQQFKVQELYYPVLEEYSVCGRLPECLLEELDNWEESSQEETL